MRHLQPVLLLIILSFTSLVHSQEIHVATDVWEGYTNKDGTGYYLEVIKSIFPAPQYSIKISYVPYMRAVSMVKSGQADVVLGVYMGDLDDKLVAQKNYVEIDEIDIVVNQSFAKTWQGVASLRDKRVVAQIGFGFNELFDTPMKYSEKVDLVGMLKMLKSGRTDAVIDYVGDIKRVWSTAGMNDDFAIIRRIKTNKTYFAFSQKKPALKVHFEDKFSALVASGKIKAIGLKHGLNEASIPQ